MSDIGHKVSCPKCKGTFPIVEGALTTSFYGKGVALAGMKTACGAILIASQFTDIVEYGGAAASAASADRTSPAAVGADIGVRGRAEEASTADEASASHYDDRFVLLNETSGEPLAYTEYAIRRASGAIEHGTTDAKGHTHLLTATATAEVVDIYV